MKTNIKGIDEKAIEEHIKDIEKNGTRRPTCNWCYALVKFGTTMDPVYVVKEIMHRDDKVLGLSDVSLKSGDPESLLETLKLIIKDVKRSCYLKNRKEIKVR